MGIVERQPRTGRSRLMPPPDTCLEDGDKPLVQGAFEVLTELRQRTAELTADLPTAQRG